MPYYPPSSNGGSSTLTANSTATSGFVAGSFPRSDGSKVQATDNLFVATATKDLIFNDTGIAQASLFRSGAGGPGFYAYSVSPWIQMLGVGNHIGWGGITFGGAYNGGSGVTPTQSTTGDALGQSIYLGYDTSAWVIGAAIQVVPLQNWTAGANGSQLQWGVVPSGATYTGTGQAVFCMTLDQTTGFGLSVPINGYQLNLSYNTGGTPINSAAWTTNGIQIKGVGTYKDTTSSGTVAAAYTRALGAETISATSATTYTNYFAQYFKAPIAGTNVTFTNGWALGADSAKLGTLTIALAAANTTALASTGYSLTGSNASNFVDLAGTWNTSGTPTAIKVAITNTAANAAALLMDLQGSTGGATSMFKVRASDGAMLLNSAHGWFPTSSGLIFAVTAFPAAAASATTASASGSVIGASSIQIWPAANQTRTAILGRTITTGLELANTCQIGWSSSSDSAGSDAIMTRGAAANIQLGAITGSGAATAQTLSVQGSSGASAAAALFTIAGSDQTGTTTTGGGLKIRGGNGTSAGGAVEIWTSATTTPAVAVSVAADKSTTFSGRVITLASATGAAGFNLPSGTAPTSPVNGDMWYDGTNLMVRLNGATKTVTVS